MVEIREMRAFVAVVEEGAMSAAARRLHLSQPALSQTIAGIERQLGVQLLVRSNTGVQVTEVGMVLLAEVRAVLARYEHAMAAVARHTGAADGVLRVGIPLELPADLLARPLAVLAAKHPNTRVLPQHMSTSAQFAKLAAGELDIGLVRERPLGQEWDAFQVVCEELGVLVSADVSSRLAGPHGIRLDALANLTWVSFPRSGSPRWYDEIVAILASHGVDAGPRKSDASLLIGDVKLAAVAGGNMFALAPPNWSQPIPESVCWHPLVGHPLVRRTWAAWPADSHRRDLATFVAALGETGAT
jgi:DNA-binding transcriptional LysR family regulator